MGLGNELTHFKNCTIYLIGFQGVGKLSIAREIVKQVDFRLVDNHAINNLVFQFVRENGKEILPPEIWLATRRIREVVLETMTSLGKRDFNFIFTNVLIEGEPEDLEVYERLEKAVTDRAGCFIPVRIVCQEEEHRKRIGSPEREANLKQTDTSVVSRLHSASEPLRPDHPHSWTLDVTTLTPEEAAKKILEHRTRLFTLLIVGSCKDEVDGRQTGKLRRMGRPNRCQAGNLIVGKKTVLSRRKDSRRFSSFSCGASSSFSTSCLVSSPSSWASSKTFCCASSSSRASA